MNALDKIKDMTYNTLGKASDFARSEGLTMAGLTVALTGALAGSFGTGGLAAYASGMERTGQQMGQIMTFLTDAFTVHAQSIGGHSYSMDTNTMIGGLIIAGAGIGAAVMGKLYESYKKGDMSHKDLSMAAKNLGVKPQELNGVMEEIESKYNNREYGKEVVDGLVKEIAKTSEKDLEFALDVGWIEGDKAEQTKHVLNAVKGIREKSNPSMAAKTTNKIS